MHAHFGDMGSLFDRGMRMKKIYYMNSTMDNRHVGKVVDVLVIDRFLGGSV